MKKIVFAFLCFGITTVYADNCDSVVILMMIFTVPIKSMRVLMQTWIRIIRH